MNSEPNYTNLATAGAKRALDHAEAITPSWGDEALAHFIRYAKTSHGASFLTADVKRAAESIGFPPAPDNRAWGSIPITAKRLGYVMRAGFGAAPNSAAHSGPRSLWVWTGKTA